jgi:sugar phosphate permease
MANATMLTKSSRPTHVRYLIVLLTTAAAFILYLDRFCLSIIERFVKEDLQLSDDQIALLLSAFFWSYALAQVPSGWFSDRWGARRMLTLYIVLWSLATGLMGLTASFLVLLALRLGCGLAQAGAYPTSAGLLSNWVPLTRRGLASSVVAVGGRAGGVAAQVMTLPIMVALVPLATSSLLGPGDVENEAGLVKALSQTGDSPPARLAARIRELWPTPGGPSAGNLQADLNTVLRRPELFQPGDLKDWSFPQQGKQLAARPVAERTASETERLNRLLLEAAYPKEVRKLYGLGWRPVVIAYGWAGIAIAFLFWLGFRDRPRAYRLCNAAEVALIEQGRSAGALDATQPLPSFPLRGLLTNFSFLMNCAAQFFTNFGWVLLLTWLPRYLDDVHHVPVEERGLMAGIPVFVGIAGMLMGGWLTDRTTLAFGLRWGRSAVLAGSRFVAMAAFLACLVISTPWGITAALALVAFFTDLGTPSMWAYAQDVGGRHVASVLGWGNMWGNIGAALSPIVLNRVVAQWGWDVAFCCCAGAFLLSGLTSLGVDARSKVASEDEANGVARAE